MRKIETAEQARVGLATYEAEVGRRGGASAMEEADKAVEAWRSRVGAVEKPPAEDADMRTKRDAARALLDDVRMALKTHNVADEGLPAVVTGIMAAKEALRTEVADLRSKLAVVDDMHDKAVAAQDRLLADLAQAWEALGSHGQPGRTLAGSIQALRNNWETTHANNAALRAEVVELGAALPPGEGTVVERVKRLVLERQETGDRNVAYLVERDAIGNALPAGPGTLPQRVKALVSERNGLQEDLAAMKERLAEAEKQLAGVRIILEASGVPARGTLEERLRAALELTLGPLPVEACTGSGKHAASGQGRELVCPECRQGPPTVECDGVWVREHGRQA